MKSDHLPRKIAFLFFVAVAGYLLVFYGLEHLRSRRGPWQVAFTHSTAANPRIVIAQPSLRITNVQVTFQSAPSPGTNMSLTLSFAQPEPVPFSVPFGKCVFMDTTFLPGTISFELFGHAIELLPRVLVIDRSEYPWQSGTNILVNH